MSLFESEMLKHYKTFLITLLSALDTEQNPIARAGLLVQIESIESYIKNIEGANHYA